MRRLPLALLAFATVTHAAALQGAARGWVGPGIDTNAKRDYVTAGAVDGFAFGLVQLQGSADFESVRLAAAYDVAARKFFTLATEDTVVQNANLEGMVALGRAFAVGLAGRARDRRGAERDYTDLIGEAVVDFIPDDAVEVRARVGAHRFVYWNRFDYSFSGPDFSLQGRYRFNRRHSASLFANLNLRTYNALTHEVADSDAPQVTRSDSVVAVGLSYSYRGPFHLTAGYAYYDQTSNSFGETIRRHRFTVTAGVRLPWQLMVLATGALQFTQTPDGVYLSPDLQVIEDDENSSSVTLKVVRPIAEHFEVDVRYALYVNSLPDAQFFYLRQVISAGVSVSF